MQRKQFEIWNKALEEHKKKTDEIVDKISKRLQAEESDQNFSNWFLSLQNLVFGTTDFCHCPENQYTYTFLNFSGKYPKTWNKKKKKL